MKREYDLEPRDAPEDYEKPSATGDIIRALEAESLGDGSYSLRYQVSTYNWHCVGVLSPENASTFDARPLLAAIEEARAQSRAEAREIL